MASRRQKPKDEKEKRVRVNLRLPPELVEWAKEYAEDRHMTLTQVFVQKLVELHAEDTR